MRTRLLLAALAAAGLGAGSGAALACEPGTCPPACQILDRLVSRPVCDPVDA